MQTHWVYDRIFWNSKSNFPSTMQKERRCFWFLRGSKHLRLFELLEAGLLKSIHHQHERKYLIIHIEWKQISKTEFTWTVTCVEQRRPDTDRRESSRFSKPIFQTLIKQKKTEVTLIIIVWSGPVTVGDHCPTPQAAWPVWGRRINQVERILRIQTSESWGA